MRVKSRTSNRLKIVLLGLGLALAHPAQSQPPDINKDWHQNTKKGLDEVRKTDAKAALAGARAWLAAHPGLVKDDPYTLSQVYEWMGWLHRVELKDYPGSQTILDEGIALLSTSFERQILVGQKARFLVWDGKAKEAEALLAREWPLGVAEDIRRVQGLAEPYVELLNNSGKSAQAAAMLRELQQNYPARVNWFPFEWLPKMLVESQLKAGASEEALGWAKLFWMAGPFREDRVNESTQLLLQAWKAELTPAKGVAFLKAQEDATAPNPLRDVALPTFQPEQITAQLAEFNSPRLAHEHITLRIIEGDWHQAMLEARAHMIANIDDPRAAVQVCRVFKAADLNLIRANAFLEFLKTGEGKNPIAAFLKEHPKKNADPAE